MSAGTVISGGFPGRVAQEVNPNQKCSGCLHYDGQVGRTGSCTIGDSPWKCGDGDAPMIGYAPIVRGAGSYLPDLSNHGAHAPEVDPQHVGGLYGSGSTRPVEVRQVSLGEEHVHLVKSTLARHAELEKSQCLRCSMSSSHGTSPHNVGPQPCTCQPIEAATIAKAVVARMSNAQRAGLTLGDVAEWVRGVAKAGFRLPAPKAIVEARLQLSLPDQVRIDGNGGHLRPISKPPSRSESAVVSKSFYSDEWITQFKGTPLFDEARKLCEQELVMEEDQLKRRQERLKHDKVRAAAVAKVTKPNSVEPDFGWQEQDARRDKIRIAKQRLALKLAGLHQENMVAAKAW